MVEDELTTYGLDDFFRAQVEARAGEAVVEAVVPARVISQHRERLGVTLGGRVGFARLKSATFYHGNDVLPYPVVGDFVLMTPNPAGDGVIHDVLDRKSVLRRSAGERTQGEELVANFDKIFVVVAGDQELNRRRLERYVAACWASGAEPGVVITKVDVAEGSGELRNEVDELVVGMSVFPVSSATGEGIAEFQDTLIPRETIVFVGPSGVGKSSLVNRLAGTELMLTGGVRAKDIRGRHTTTHRELFMLKNGTMVIDTPGLRALGMVEATPIDTVFDEIARLADGCRFTDCTHRSEPGCAVLEARRNGILPKDRWQGYVKLLREARFEESRRDVSIRLEEKKRWKEIRKSNRANQRKL